MTTTSKTQNKITERPPVVAVVGHIDHGKSTLLDYIRKSNVVEGEAGGITQHISAYEVEHKNPENNKIKKITFLDTPGHEAFSKMRRRGASIADIAILIVSAEEGVKPQTIESIEAIKEADIPFVVAINKIDRPNSNPDKIKQELAEADVYVEGYGGDVSFALVSAKTGEGIPDLLDLILLTAEINEFTGNKNKDGEGFVLESVMSDKAGTMVTLIIKNGFIKTGQFLGINGEVAKIKKIENFLGKPIKEATFSSPVRVFGFRGSVEAGSKFITLENKKEANAYLKTFEFKEKISEHRKQKESDKNKLEIPLVVKSDSEGTLEAVLYEIGKLKDDRVKFKIVSTGVGAISDGDIKTLIGSSDPLVVGFHVKKDRSAEDLAERHEATLETFDIIYKLTEWLEEEMKKRRPELTEEKSIGKAKVLKVFSQNKDKQVIGARTDEGVIKIKAEVNIIRRESKIGKGKVVNLQAQKIAVDEVSEGNQFGAMIESRTSIAEGDKLEIVEMVTTS